MTVKVNDQRYQLYKDKLGPYDSYYYHKNFYDDLPKGTKVVRVFDMFGDHIAVVRKYIPGPVILWVILPIIVATLFAAFVCLQSKSENCIVYKPHDFYVTSDNRICLEIANMNPEPLYIIVGDMCYELGAYAWVDYINYYGGDTITLWYKGCKHTEELK